MLRLFIAAAALLVVSLAASNVAKADTTDPAIGVKGGCCSVPWTGTFTVIFEPVAEGGTPGVNCFSGVCSYDSNNTEQAFFITTGSITNFDYAFSRSQNTGFSVATDSVFTMITIINDVSSPNPEAILSGGTILPPCPSCDTTPPNTIAGDFALEVSGVLQGTTGTITSNVPIPEPGTIVLMASGLGVAAWRRRRAAKQLPS
jgi:hypothetical protein